VFVFAVSRVVPGNPTEAPPEEKQAIEQQLVQLLGVDDQQALVHSLRDRVKVTVAEDRL
jgi:peptidyl-prolyl cis-trans isomerase D